MLPTPLRDSLVSYTPDHWPLTTPVALRGGGGRSGSLLWRWTSPSGDLLLRLWPEEVAAARVAQIHAWLKMLGGLPFIPRPIPDRDGQTFQVVNQRLVHLEPWMPGNAVPRDAWDEACVSGAFSALRQVHDALSRAQAWGRSAAASLRLREIQALRTQQLGMLSEAVSRTQGLEADLARDWMQQASPRLATVEAALARVVALVVPVQPSIRDCRIEHFLFEAQRIVGLVDFGALDVDTPWVDVARLLVDLDDAPRRRVALDTYRRDDEGITLLMPLCHAASLLIGAHWIRWHFVEGRRFEGTDTVAERLRYAIARLTTTRE